MIGDDHVVQNFEFDGKSYPQVKEEEEEEKEEEEGEHGGNEAARRRKIYEDDLEDEGEGQGQE